MSKEVKFSKYILPEVYLHYKIDGTIEIYRTENFKSKVEEITVEAFRNYKEYKPEFIITIDEGTVKLRHKLTVAGLLGFLASYTAIKSGAIDLATDLLDVLTVVEEGIEANYFSPEKKIKRERRVGVTRDIGKVVTKYQNGDMTHIEYQEEMHQIALRLESQVETQSVLRTVRIHLNDTLPVKVDWDRFPEPRLHLGGMRIIDETEEHGSHHDRPQITQGDSPSLSWHTPIEQSSKSSDQDK